MVLLYLALDLRISILRFFSISKEHSGLECINLMIKEETWIPLFFGLASQILVVFISAFLCSSFLLLFLVGVVVLVVVAMI